MNSLFPGIFHGWLQMLLNLIYKNILQIILTFMFIDELKRYVLLSKISNLFSKTNTFLKSILKKVVPISLYSKLIAIGFTKLFIYAIHGGVWFMFVLLIYHVYATGYQNMNKFRWFTYWTRIKLSIMSVLIAVCLILFKTASCGIYFPAPTMQNYKGMPILT